MNKQKDLIRSILISIAVSFSIFCIAGVVYDITGHGSFSLGNYGFTKMVVGCVIVGLGFGIPSMIYNNENLPMAVKVIIHMGIGCVVNTIVAYSVGWAGTPHIGRAVLIVIMQIAIAFLIWLCFMCFYRNEAHRMNERLNSMKKQ